LTRAARTVVLLGAVVASCAIPDLDLTGKACPCAAGYVCDETTNVCVSSLSPRADGGPGDAAPAADAARPDVAAPRVVVTNLRAAWATPNQVRWEWDATGEAAAFDSYVLEVASTEADLEKGAPRNVFTRTQRPELSAFDARGSGGGGGARVWSVADTLEPGTRYVARVKALDVTGGVSLSNIATTSTAAAPRAALKVVFDGQPRTARPADEYVLKTGASTEAHYELTVACGAGVTSCDKRGALVNLGLDLAAPDPFDAAAFARAFVAFEVDGGAATAAAGSSVMLELGATCAGPECRYTYVGWTQDPSKKTLIQVPLRELENAGGKLTYGRVVAAGALLDGFELAGRWRDGTRLNLYTARVRW